MLYHVVGTIRRAESVDIPLSGFEDLPFAQQCQIVADYGRVKGFGQGIQIEISETNECGESGTQVLYDTVEYFARDVGESSFDGWTAERQATYMAGILGVKRHGREDEVSIEVVASLKPIDPVLKS